jgi:Domain of unknown function (DUF4332)
VKHTCNCKPEPCQTGLLDRPRYFPRQLITPGELTLEQDYFRSKLRRHNRMLHGWGVVCGALVDFVPVSPSVAEVAAEHAAAPKYEPWKVRIQPGYILGPFGDEIVIDCEHMLDLRGTGLTGAPGEAPQQAIDPWCSQVEVKRPGSLYVAIKYKEVMSRPVRVQPIGCGCDETQCEYSRWRDCYEIGILDHCPETQKPPSPDINTLIRGETPDCPDCPQSPWLVLARVDLAEDGTILRIDNCDCRRLVVSFGDFWWHCQSRTEPPRPDDLSAADRLKQIEVSRIEGIGADQSMRLNQHGIRTVHDLLVRAAAPEGRKELAEKINARGGRGIGERELLHWVSRADLMRVSDINEQHAELLAAAGVVTVSALADRDAKNLMSELRRVQKQKKLAPELPKTEVVEKWIASAQKLSRVVVY